MVRRTALVCSALLSSIVVLTNLGVSGAAAATVTSGSCTSTVGNATNVSMTVDSSDLCVLRFMNTGSTTWTVPAGVTSADVLIVGGGGAGAWSDVYAQGGGGGGGVAFKSALSVSGTYSIVVGAGGTGTNSPLSWTSGSASSFGNGSLTITADGGGAGAGWGGAVGFNGGSGGGGHWYNSGNDKGLATKGSFSGVTGVQLYGNDGGNSNLMNSAGGGGGGATTAGTNGTAGQVGGNGGEGLSSDISGTSVVYGSGGSGIGNNGVGTPGTNAGSGRIGAQGGDGLANSGAGGGAGAFAYRSGHGGSGQVIIRFAIPAAPANSVTPSVSGTTTNGQTLNGSRGTWSGYPAPTYTYRWKRAATAGGTYTNITGATSLTYTLTDDDIDKYLKFEVTATNASGSTVESSAATARVADMVRPTTTTTTSTTTTTMAPALVIEVAAPTTVPVTVPSATTTVAVSVLTIPVVSVAPRSPASTTTTVAAPTTTSTVVKSVVTTTVVPPPPAQTVQAGEAGARIDGEDKPATVERVNNQLVVQVGPLSATIGAVGTDGNPGALDDDGNVRLKPGDTVRIKVAGFEPGSTVEAWMFSTPVRMGTATVSDDGTVTGNFRIPANITDGDHRIVIVARTADGKPATLTVGVLVGDWKKVANITAWLIVLPIALAGLGALTLPATRRRRRRLSAGA